MALSITHTTVAVGTDAGNGEIAKTQWNEAHTITGLGTGVETWLQTPSGANLASALTTALPASKGGTGLTSLGTGVATWLGTPTSANLLTVVTDALGTGKLIFSAGTLAVASGKTLTVSNTLTFTGTDSSSVAFGAGGTVLYSADLYTTAFSSTWNGVTNKALTPDVVYDQFETYVHPAYIAANWYYLNDQAPLAASGGALGADTVLYVPTRFYRTVTLSDLGARTLAAGTFALAIYANNEATGRPSGTPLAATGDIVAGGAGFSSGDITGANVSFPPGRYWLAFWTSSGTITMLTVHGSALSQGGYDHGDPTATNIISSNAISYWTSAETYNSSAWPNATTETLTAAIGQARAPIILGKAA